METEMKHYTIRGAIEYLGLSDNQIYKAIYEKRLAAEKQGTKWNISRQALDAYWDTYVMPLNSTPPGSIEGQVTTEEVIVNREIEEAPSESQAVEELPLKSEETHEPVTQPANQSTYCRRCHRLFSDPSEYVFAMFVESAGPAFYPVCRDSRCDPALVNAQRERDALLTTLIAVRRFIDDIIVKCEEKQESEE